MSYTRKQLKEAIEVRDNDRKFLSEFYSALQPELTTKNKMLAIVLGVLTSISAGIGLLQQAWL
ncbi:MAG: hypothetical protein ACR5KV_01625 [Wolbachia sp.]